MNRSDATNLTLVHGPSNGPLNESPDGSSLAHAADDLVIRGWCARRIGDLAHEDRVAAHADRLFELLAPLHKLDADARRTLHRAAWLHDVGRCIADDGHEALGAEMITADTTLPVGHAERTALAYLTHRHRGRVPANDTLLDDRASRRTMRLLLALLRGADALDNRRTDPATLVLMRRGRTIVVHAYAPHLTRHLRKLQTGRKKFALLRDTLGVKFEVEVHLADMLTVAA